MGVDVAVILRRRDGTRRGEENSQDVSTASTSISIATAVAIVTGGSCQQCMRDQDTIHTYYIYASIHRLLTESDVAVF